MKVKLDLHSFDVQSVHHMLACERTSHVWFKSVQNFLGSLNIYSSWLYQILMNGKPVLSHNMRNILQDKHIIIENVKFIACKHVQTYHFCSNLHQHDYIGKRVNRPNALTGLCWNIENWVSGTLAESYFWDQLNDRINHF